MTYDIYSQIRHENIEKYGTRIDQYGPVLLANLYSDKTHFIYELLQNAEDAFERDKKTRNLKNYFVRFELFPDRLEVRHNGIPFDDDDVRGICGIVEGTKAEDTSQIGRFGIGFKSVYAYSKSPKVYSGKRTFLIQNYVQPVEIQPREDVEESETLFVIPFNISSDRETTFFDIEERLKNLGLRTLLFTKNTSTISWVAGETRGTFNRTQTIEKSIRKVHLEYKSNHEPITEEQWLVLDKNVTLEGEEQLKVEVAFLESNDANGNDLIVPATNTKLVAFFPTEKTTNLKFLIHGPFQTTPARDNIMINAWNRALIEELAQLAADSIATVKEMGLLDLSYLETLPLESKLFTEYDRLRPFYDRVRKMLSGGGQFLPACGGDYISAQQALLVRGKDLRDLLSNEQLQALFGKVGARWLNENITQSNTPLLRDYLINALSITEVDPERFAKELSSQFLKQQSDEWLVRFYGYLIDQKALWRKGSDYEREGVLRSRTIIRLNDGTHVVPFDPTGKPLAYLPSKFKQHFPTVKESIARDERANEFLKLIGLAEPDRISGLLDKILPIYSKDTAPDISTEEQIQHTRWIINTVRASSDDSRYAELIEKVASTPFLMVKKDIGELSLFKARKTDNAAPKEVYLGQKYTGTDDLETFFEGDQNVYCLSERYLQNGFNKDDFELLGCKTRISVQSREPDWQGNVRIACSHGRHKRGLNGFDPDCVIEGLEHCLNHITAEKARIIWDTLKRESNKISGYVESSSRANYSGSTKTETYSKLGNLLLNYAWIPSVDGQFHLPAEVQLADLPDDFDRESLEAKRLAEKLKLKTDLEGKFFEQHPEFKQLLPICNEMKNLTDAQQKNMIASFLEWMNKSKHPKVVPTVDSTDALREQFENGLSKNSGTTAVSDGVPRWTGLSPEEVEDIRKQYGQELPNRLENIRLLLEQKRISRAKVIDTINPKQFLFEQYGGSCQVCNTKLDLGDGKMSYFEIFRIVETRNLYGWSNMEFNIVCVCPNCHALLKHGGRELGKIIEVAQGVSRNEVAAQEIDDRQGDYYVVQIQVAGRDREIFYSPMHMAKISAFIEDTDSALQDPTGTRS